jgi:hypothetical protein
MRGTRSIFKTEKGLVGAGFQSSLPWVFVIYGDQGPLMACERCVVGAIAPDPPKSAQAPGVQSTPLFRPESIEYATYFLTTLHTFARAHAACEKPLDKAQ